MAETISVFEENGFAISPGATWSPIVGEELLRFLDRVPPGAKERTQQDAVKILARGTEPGQVGVSAGLVVGYVQSGKTTSFTAATALARDNAFALVIVIAGTSVNLLEQTQQRLEDELALGENDAYRRWVLAKSPKPDTEEASKIEAALEDWLDPSVESTDRATVLITVMKQHRHLEWLGQTLDEIGSRLNLAAVTALIVDDEADQASPNLKKKAGDESATYGRIRRVRSTLPSHTLLEYTATPQAPLLVSLVDELSPDYVAVLDAGDEYTGGRYFFQEHRDDFIKHIPTADSAAIDEESHEPPASLLKAFATFALGAAAGNVPKATPPQRSMLVHPSQKTLPQARFVGWLKRVRDLWASLLKEDVSDLDRQALVDEWLLPAYERLSRSEADLPGLDVLLGRLPGTLRKTMVVEVNATKGRPQPIPWSTGYAWILVGGQLLDRGFTVEGLTVTYMPRSLGVGNADTVQQRARFLGYKRSYAGYCRAWLDPEVDAAFTSYVEHEETMRRELIQVANTGESLKDWKRVFYLSKRMKLTRASVIRLATDRSSFGNKWFDQGDFDGADESIFHSNRELADHFSRAYTFVDDPGDDRRNPETQIHPYADVPLADVLEKLLEQFVMTDGDAVEFANLRLLLAVAGDQSDEVARVHQMMARSPKHRMRSLDPNGRIKNLFQGSNKATGYDGDRSVKEAEAITVQIHRLDLRGDDGTDDGASSTAVGEDVPVLAIWVPERFDASVIVQRM